jgi:hypothetical protein
MFTNEANRWVCDYQDNDAPHTLFPSDEVSLLTILKRMKTASAKTDDDSVRVRTAAVWWSNLNDEQKQQLCQNDPTRHHLIVPEHPVCYISNKGRQIVVLPPSTRLLSLVKWWYHTRHLHLEDKLCSALGIQLEHKHNYAVLVLDNLLLSEPRRDTFLFDHGAIEKEVCNYFELNSLEEYTKKYYTTIKQQLLTIWEEHADIPVVSIEDHSAPTPTPVKVARKNKTQNKKAKPSVAPAAVCTNKSKKSNTTAITPTTQVKAAKMAEKQMNDCPTTV